jgi:TRAP-type C4-dicarboxylate transport system permease small subunit
VGHSIPNQEDMDILLRRLCDYSAALGGGVLIAIACMTTVSVIGRAFFSHPILGDVELVQLGTAVVVASFLPYAQFHRGNITVDFFTNHASQRAQDWMDCAGCALYALTMMLILWRVAVGCLAMKEAGERSMLMDLPLWLPYLLMLPGLLLCSIIGLLQTLQHARDAMKPAAVRGEA